MMVNTIDVTQEMMIHHQEYDGDEQETKKRKNYIIAVGKISLSIFALIAI